MPRKAKITTDLGYLSDPLFSDATTVIVNSINDNIADFGFLTVPTSVIATDIDNFNKCRLKPHFPSQVSETNDLRTLVQKSITINGNIINTTADGNLTLLKKSGYPLQKDAEAQGQLEATTVNLNATKVAGELEYFISHLKGGTIRYGIMITEESNLEINPAKWTFHYCGSREGIIAGLLSLTRYKVCSFGMGTDEKLTYSDPVISAPL